MGVMESIRGVMWARKRQPDELAYGVALAHERFSPPELVQQAVAAEQAGFDAVCCSDHLAPWWEPRAEVPAHCGNAWVWLGAAGQATQQVSIGSAVTGIVHRYNPVVVAQQVATLETLCPGRAFLGVGSGEAMNEVPAGLEWPSVGEQLTRTEEALTIIKRLLDRETVDFGGTYFRATHARLYLDHERRPPIYMSAPDDDAALEGAREWKGTLADENYTDAVAEPADVEANGAQVSDRTFKAMGLIGSDPAAHVRQIKLMQKMGATAIVIMNISGADPLGMLRVYGEHVLPQLREP
jgi:coenzyme F420-dependent glucose-6-phosphate dehydrogenase